MILIISAIVIAFTAYVFIPSLFGFKAHRQWDLFRTRIIKSSLHPTVKFTTGTADGPLGAHRFVGRIEALQGDDTLWVRGSCVSIRATMEGAQIYLLPAEDAMPSVARTLLEERLPEENPKPMAWKRITSLQEGSWVYLAGFLERKDGLLTMYGSKDIALIALLHEGKDVVPRAVWSGRQKNEYWNALTPWALFAGSLVLFIMASAVFRNSQFSWTARFLLILAISPVVPLLPPGIIFFLIYLSNWRRARFLRAERDLLALSAYLRAGDAKDQVEGWGDDIPTDIVPLIQSCKKRALTAEIVSVAAFVLGFALNIFLVILVLNATT